MNKDKHELVIFHMADMQIELRVSGSGGQRFDEFESVFKESIFQMHSIQPDVVVIAGDVYQFESTTGDEQKMFSNLLHSILEVSSVKRIIIIPGNHDVKQKHNGIYRSGVKSNVTDSIDAVVSAIKDPRISYYQHTGIYKDPYFDMSWAVWSQFDKWSAKEPKPAYSPWIENEIPEGPFIELYHDPKRGAKGFDGQVSAAHKDYKVSLEDFRSNTILAGDIHAPEIVKFGDNNERLFAYSSSLVIRNFGEGDYYSNGNLLHMGNAQHGYNVIRYCLEEDRAIDCKFFQVANPVIRSTMYMNSLTIYTEESLTSMINKLQKGTVNYVRFVCQDAVSNFIEAKQMIAEVCYKLLPNCQISFAYDSEILGLDVDESLFEDLSTAVDPEKILELSKSYVERVVNKTSTISKEDKEKAIEYLFSILTTQLSLIDLTSTTKRIEIDEVEIRNFMKLGNTIFTFTGQELNVISGANGIGKSTAIHVINWINNDRISENQSMRDKKYNNLMYFNTCTEDDEVYAKETFRVDGIKHILEKTIERTWKTGKKDIKSPTWMDNIKSVKVSHKLIIEENDNRREYIDNEAVDILQSLFTFDSMQKLTFVNSQTIHKLMNSAPEDIAQDFLEIMGLDISNALTEGFENLKYGELLTLRKPSDKIEDIIADIESYEISQNSASDKLDLANIELSSIDDRIEKTKTDIDNIELTKTNVQSEESLLVDIRSNTELLTNNEKAINSSNIELNELNSLNDINIDEANSLLIQQMNEKSNIEKLISDERNLNLLLDSRISEQKVKASELTSTVKDQLADEQAILREMQNVHQNSINVANYSITAVDMSITELKQFHTNALQLRANDAINLVNVAKSELHSIEIAKNTKLSSIAMIDHTINNLSNDIAKYENSKVANCSSCGQKPNETSIAVIEENIRRCNNDIEVKNADKSAITSELEENLLNIDKKKKQLEFLETAYKNIYESYSNIEIFDSIISELDEYQQLRSKKSELTLSIDSANVEISKLNDKLSELQLTLQSRILEHPEYAIISAAINSIAEEKNQSLSRLNALNLQLTEKIVEIEESSLRIQSSKNKQEQLQKINNEIASLTFEKSALESERSRLHQIAKTIESNKLLDLTIEPYRKELQNLNSNRQIIESTIRTLNINFSVDEERLSNKRKDLDDAKKYNLVESSLKLYKKIIGKDGLPQFVFAHLIPLINAEFDKALSDVKFRLMFDSETLELRFFDIESQVSRPMMFISGMERTTSSLIITQIRRKLNRQTLFNFMFIDEISGTLNDGTGLDYIALNYKAITIDYINRLSKNVPIYIIDHVLDFGPEAQIIEVTPGDNGSTFEYK